MELRCFWWAEYLNQGSHWNVEILHPCKTYHYICCVLHYHLEEQTLFEIFEDVESGGNSMDNTKMSPNKYTTL